MRLAPRAFAALCGALCGTAAWTAAGVLAVDTVAGPLRVIGLIPSFTALAMAAAIGTAVAMWTASLGVPAGVFLLPVIGSIAWTTIIAWPAIVAWAGPLSIIPFALLGAGILVSTLATARDAAWLRPFTHHLDSRWSPGVATAATGLWLLAILTAATSLQLTGDEPRYLLVTQSLLADGDVDLTNNYDAETYRAFYNGPLERHVTLGALGQQYSFHGLALSFLLIPGFALGNVLGARLLIVFITAVGAGFFWSTVRRLTHSSAAAWAAWLAMLSAAPFALHGILLYPDGVAAAISSFAIWVLVGVVLGPMSRTRAIVLSGLALGTLPWFHIRLSLSAGLIGIATVRALAARRRDLILPFLAAPIVSFVLWIATTWVMFRTLDPTAAFREKAAGTLAQAPIGTLGLLFDVEYGLVTYAPVLSLSILGVAALWKRSHAIAVMSIALIVATLEVAAAWIWWGGDSAPARFLVPVIPLIALSLAAWWADASHQARSFAVVTLIIGACVTTCLAVADGGSYIVNAADGHGTIWEWLSPNVDLSLALPSLFRPGAQPRAEAIVAASWIVVGAMGLALTVFRQRGSAHDAGASWLRASTVTIAWLSVGASAAWLQRDATPWTPDRGQLRMLHAATSPALINGVHGAGWHDESPTTRPHFTTRESAVSSLSIATPTARATPVRLHVPFVPAGRYAIEVERPSAIRDLPAPRLSLSLGRNSPPAISWFVTPSHEAPTFWLAVPVWSVHVETDSVSDAPTVVRLRPRHVIAPPPFTDGYALSATTGGPIAVYGMDGYSSRAGLGGGFEVVVNRPAHFIVADEQGHPVSFVIQIEADLQNGTATVSHGTFERTAPVEPMRRERFVVPAQAEALLPVRVMVSGQPRQIFGRALPVRAVVHILAE